MRRRADKISVPFPTGLMSTARSPSVMGPGYAPEIRNMLMATDGAGKKRAGMAPFAAPLPGVSMTALFDFVHDGQNQVLAATSDGCVWLWDGAAWQLLKAGFSETGLMRGVQFGGRLVLCNGVDALHAWDGSTLEVIFEYVTDPGSELVYEAGNRFRIQSDAMLYPPGIMIRLQMGSGAVVDGTVQMAVQNATTTTVTLATGVALPDLAQVAYAKRPPHFAYLYAAHDRLWGLGLEPVGPGLSSHVDRSRVFYTYGVNDPAAWHTPSGGVPSINLADKAGQRDQLVAMAVKDGMTMFFGRQTTQLWQGTDPGADGDFAWQKTVPVGVSHAGLVVELPNDVLFLNSGGARTLSRLIRTEQLDVSDVGSEIDPTLQSFMRTLMQDALSYRQAGNAHYAGENWFALKLPGGCAVLQMTGRGQNGSGWVLFDGLFAQCTAMLTLTDGRLLLAARNAEGHGQVYVYDEQARDDAGTAIDARWQTPWLQARGGRRWANHQLEVLTDGTPMDTWGLTRYRNHDLVNPKVVDLPGQRPADLWDACDWDQARWDHGEPQVARMRDHFVADTMAFAIRQAGGDAPAVLFGLALHGRTEA